MSGRNITGVHIFEKLGHIEWEDELIAIQALSALTWKKHHGRIELYCNEDHLESLKKWGVDKLYDNINTELLKTSPNNIDRKKYWTFCKLFVSSNLEPPFVLVDTDLWITDSLDFDTSKSFIAYHEEKYDWSKPNNFYVNFNNFIPEKYLNYFDLNIKPTNVALLFWNDSELLKSWYDIAYEVLSENKKCELSNSQKTIFLEQWLLPMNAVKTNKTYGVLIPQIFNSIQRDSLFESNVWDPDENEWSDDLWEIFNKIKHIWGLKRFFNKNHILREIFDKVKFYFDQFRVDGLKDLKNFIYETSNYVESKKLKSDSGLNILFCIPSFITDNSTNILIKRIESLYSEDNDIIIYVCKINNDLSDNITLKNEIINLIGTDNYLTLGDNNLNDIFIKYGINICQYDISLHDNLFNQLMDKIFNEKNINVIKSIDGINLTSNLGTYEKISYPMDNNVIKIISKDSEHKFDTEILPLHIQYQNKIIYGLNYDQKHIVCLGPLNKIPKQLINIINNFFNQDPNIIFHFLTSLDIESDYGKNILNRLTPSTKIWLENVNFYDFIKIADLVIDYNNSFSSLISESISYGIPVITYNPFVSKNDFTHHTNYDTNKTTNLINNLLLNRGNCKIPTNPQNYGGEYKKFYDQFRNMQ